MFFSKKIYIFAKNQGTFQNFQLFIRKHIVMSILKTQQSLQRMFNQSRQQQEKKQLRKTQKQQSAKRLKEIYHHQDTVLKKSLQELKKSTMDNLSKLIKKKPQEPLKPPTYEFKIYRTDWIERFADENELYTTFNELMEAQERGEGRINVEKWKEIVELTKKQLNQS